MSEYRALSAMEKRINEQYHRLALKLGLSDSVLSVLYCLTEQGRTYCSRHIRPILQAEERAFHRMTPEEQTMFFRLARKYEQYFTDGLAALGETMQEDEQ